MSQLGSPLNHSDQISSHVSSLTSRVDAMTSHMGGHMNHHQTRVIQPIPYPVRSPVGSGTSLFPIVASNALMPPALPGCLSNIHGSSLIPHHPCSQSSNQQNIEKSLYCFQSPATSNSDNNACKLIDYRAAQVAAFKVDGRELICLPQAFDLFLKHLVGGLHTVYTKLKRLDITPIVCNVEQVRILRGLGAIQPGVNRCKLISPREFDVLYEDCTNSRYCVNILIAI